MGRICPILNHALHDDGVLVEDIAIVRFIQKSNTDFLPTELVCKTCKQEVIKLYNKKLKRARELYRSRLRDGTVSSIKNSKSSSTASSVYGGSEPIVEVEQEVQTQTTAAVSVTAGLLQQQDEGINGTSINNIAIQQTNGSSSIHSLVQQNNHNGSSILTNEQLANEPSAKVLSVSETAIVLSTSISNTHSILQENGKSQIINKNSASDIKSLQPNVTIRKRTIRDFLTKSPMPTVVVPINPSATKPAQSSTNTNNFTKQIFEHKTASYQSEKDDTRRLSQEPTTSKAANRNKRPIAVIIDSDDEDDQRLSLNAVNGTRLPNVQPIPPKRRSQPKSQRSIGQDIMDEYIKDTIGG